MKRHIISLNWFKILSLNDNKLPRKIRTYFLKTMAELLDEGFAMYQALAFMEVLLPKYKVQIQAVSQKMKQGLPFEQSIFPLGYSISIVAQLFYAQKQGRFIEVLKNIVIYQEELETYRKRIIHLLIYPMFMALFLIALLFGMRKFMLPQVINFISDEIYQERRSIRLLIYFFYYLPQLTIGLLSIVLIISLFFDLYLMRLSLLKRLSCLIKIRFLRRWIQQFCSYRLSAVLGEFINSGYSILQMIEILIKYPIDPFLTESAKKLDHSLRRGETLGNIVAKESIYTRELAMIIQQGEMTSQFGKQCKVYSQKILNELLEDIARKITYIQPILFIMIAFFVMSMYLLMMLPLLTFDGI